MKDYLFVYRNEHKAAPTLTSEQAQAMMQKWVDWFAGIAAKGKLASQGNRLAPAGKVVRPNNVVTDGPYAEIKELVGGFSIVKAESFEEAAEIAKDCPILKNGGNVEIREIAGM